MLAGLLLGAFQLGRMVERDDQQGATPDFEPLVLDPRLYDAYSPLDPPAYTTPPGPDATERFSVWVEFDDGRRIQRVFEPDGKLLELTGSLTDAGAADFRVRNLSSEQRAEVAALVDETLTVDEPSEAIRGFGDRDTELKISAGVVRTVPVDSDGPPPETETAVGARTANVIDDLFDLSWLDPTLEEWSEPWAPASLTVWVDPTTVAGAGAAGPWPLDGPVLTSTHGVERGPGGSPMPYRCLEGPDAAAVFALLEPGRTALVDDAGTARRLHLFFDYPYFVVDHHRC